MPRKNIRDTISEIISLQYVDLPHNKNWILTAVLYDHTGLVIARNYHLEELWKHVKLKKPNIDLQIVSEIEGAGILIKSNHPAFFIDLYHPEYIFSDRGFFILPGEKITLDLIGKVTTPVSKNYIRIYSLNDYLKK